MRYFVADTETAGFNPPPYPASGVASIAWIEMDEELNELSQFYSLINPGCPIASGASQANGIYDKDVVDAPKLESVFQMDYAALIVGQNISFDMRFLRPFIETEHIYTICTLAMARRYLPSAPNHKLMTLVEYLNLEKHEAHNALGDTKMTLALLKELLAISGRTLAQEMQLAKKPALVQIMPFGKHKGMSMLDVPAEYLNWLQAAPDLNAEMKESIKHFKKVRGLK